MRRELNDALARCGRTGRAGAILLLGLDRFKEVSDSLGHTVGDELLVKESWAGWAVPVAYRLVTKPGAG